MAEEFIAKSGNPTIHGAGEAVFGKNHYCLWETKDGSTSTCTITNPGKANTLTFVVSGAPETMMCTDHHTPNVKFNGTHTIPPNNPTWNVTAVGDFLGTQVTIFNMSSLDTDCKVDVVVAG